MKFKLRGVLPAILTPFSRNGVRVDYERACVFATVLADRGVQGIFVCGSTGEGLLMRREERERLASELIGAVGDRIKVVVQTGCLDTPGTIDLTRHAQEAGAHAVAVYTPSFYRYDDAAILKHFERVARAVPDIPKLLYNIPQYTGNALSAELVLKLVERIESVVGMKDSSGDLAYQSRVVADTPKGFVMINGSDDLTFAACLGGALGAVASTANVVPELFVSIIDQVQRGNLERARRDQAKLSRIVRVLVRGVQTSSYGAPLSAFKEAARLQGYDVSGVRPPHRELTASEKRAIAAGLAAEGVI